MSEIDPELRVELTDVVLVDYRQAKQNSSPLTRKIQYDYRVYLSDDQLKTLEAIGANIRYGSVLSKEDPYVGVTFPSDYVGNRSSKSYHSNVVLQGVRWSSLHLTGVKFYFVSIN